MADHHEHIVVRIQHYDPPKMWKIVCLACDLVTYTDACGDSACYTKSEVAQWIAYCMDIPVLVKRSQYGKGVKL